MLFVTKEDHTKWVICIAPMLYFLFSSIFTGPTYLQDEVGYLTKAAFFAGHIIDGPSSYNWGYALFLSPLFAIFSSTALIWKGVIVVNCLFWGGSLFLVNQLSKLIYPHCTARTRLQCLLFVSLYPAWASITGYAFPSAAISFFYLLSFFLFCKINTGNRYYLILHSITVAFVYCIHPTGLSVLVASWIGILIASIRYKKAYYFVVHFFITCLIAYTYKYSHEWVNQVMTPPGQSLLEHYTTTGQALRGLLDYKILLNSIVKMLGSLSYLIVSSVGIIALAFLYYFQLLWNLFKKSSNTSTFATEAILLVYPILTTVFAIAIGSIMFATTNQNNIVHWMYGRYVEPTIIPLLVFGFLSLNNQCSKKTLVVSLCACVYLITSGSLIDLLHNPDDINNNVLNTPGFWPQYIFTFSSFSQWFAIGGLVVFPVMIFKNKNLTILLMLIVGMLSIKNQIKFHQDSYDNHSTPSSIVEIVKEDYPPNTCIAINTSSQEPINVANGERFNLYKYYFYQYHYQRMDYLTWKNTCHGPMITDDLFVVQNDNVNVIKAQEISTGLYLVEKLNDLNKSDLGNSKILSNVAVNGRNNMECAFNGCFYKDINFLSKVSQVGKTESNALLTTGKPGVLFFGPYAKLRSGSYLVTINGDFSNAVDAVVDITIDGGTVALYHELVCDKSCSDKKSVKIEFKVEKDVSDLEIRMFVSAADDIKVINYQVTENK